MTDTIDKDIKEQFEIQTDHNLASLHDADWWADYFDHDQEFGAFMEDAYSSEGKYSIRVNPYTGKKEMMVAGTDSYGNWLQNVAEGTPSAWKGVSLKKREEASEYYDEIARQNNVDVIYGHSRGAAHLTDMQYEATYVGIDGATSIGHKRPDMVNVIGDQFFDKVIGRGHKDTVRLEGRGFHNVTKSKARVKRENTNKKQLVARAKKQAKFQDKSKFTAKKTRTRSEIRKTDPRKKKKVKNERRRTRRVYNKRRF
ncbi:hypothetical protein [Chaetoceros debilis DNA virus 83]|nr:hypothetical protein [Chaetoceros debilis DNA virus 83]